LVEAQLDYDRTTGEYGYGGESDVFWDTQEPVTAGAGVHRHLPAAVKPDEVYLQCDQGHHWWAKPLSMSVRELPA